MSSDLLERLRAARLHRQRQAPDQDSLVRDSVGLHSTDYWTPYLSARARVAGFAPTALFTRLNTGDGLVRLNSMRLTVHVVCAEDLPMISAATGEAVTRNARSSPELKGRSDAELQAGLDRIGAALEAGPLGNNELKAAVPELGSEARYWLLYAMGRGLVLRADAAHARSNRTRYALTNRWIPGFKVWEHGATEARRQLLVRAVRSFGPLTESDLAWWLPATRTEVRRALASMGRELGSLDVDGVRYHYAVELADAPAPPRASQGAWLLPYEDALLKGYQDRRWCLAPGLREVLFPFSVAHWHPPDGQDPGPGPHKGVNLTGEARPSIWWGGRVVGRWEHGDARGETGVKWQVHAEIGAEGREAVAAEIARLERFLGELGGVS